MCPRLKIGDFGDYGIHKTNGIVTSPPPLKIDVFSDHEDQTRILSLNKTTFKLNTCPGLKTGDFGD